MLLNAHDQGIAFILPGHDARVRWEPVLDTRAWDVEDRGRAYRPGEVYDLDGPVARRAPAAPPAPRSMRTVP